MTTKSKYTPQDTINRLEKLEKLKNDKVYQQEIKTSKTPLKKGQTNFEELLLKTKTTKTNLQKINEKNKKIIEKRVKDIINYSIEEAEAVELLVRKNRIQKLTYNVTTKNTSYTVNRLSFFTPFYKKIIEDRKLNLSNK